MIRRLATGLAIAAMGLPLGAQSGEPRKPEVRTSVTDERRVPATRATITVTVEGTGPSRREAGDSAAVRVRRIRDAVAAFGVPRDSVVSTGWADWWSDGSRVRTSERRTCSTGRSPRGDLIDNCRTDTTFTVTDRVLIRLRDLSRAAGVSDTLLTIGAKGIGQVQFQAAGRDTLQEALLTSATQKLKRQAEVMADAAGGRLGALIELTTEPRWSDEYDRELMLTSVTNSRSSDARSEVVVPTVRLAVTVRGRWEFVPR